MSVGYDRSGIVLRYISCWDTDITKSRKNWSISSSAADAALHKRDAQHRDERQVHRVHSQTCLWFPQTTMKAKLKCLFKTEKTRLKQSRSHVFSFKTLRYIETSHLTYLHTYIYIYIHINIDLCQKTWDRHWRVASLVCLCELVWRYRTASSVYWWIQNSLEKRRDEHTHGRTAAQKRMGFPAVFSWT